MKSTRILVLPVLLLLAGCASTPEQAKSSSRPADTAQLRSAYVPVTGSGGSSGFQQFRR